MPETRVYGAGRKPNAVMLVGEAPGREEASRGQPFVGRSGQEQEAYLARRGLSARTWYRTNVVKTYIEGNPDPTPSLVARWTPVLEEEVCEVDPALIIAVGRFAARWFLGDGVEMDAVHGLPHEGGAFDESRAGRAQGAVVLPIYHPALGLYDGDARAVIDWDYGQVAATLKKIKSGAEIELRHDEYAGKEVYLDVGGAELAAWLAMDEVAAVGFDTEGSPSAPWSLQVSLDPGTGLVLRRDREDFAVGVSALQRSANDGTVFVMHNAMFDLEMARVMGLDLADAALWDSMYAAYLMRLEPQALKSLAYRWAGMKMGSYSDTVGDVGRDKQVDYLLRVLEMKWDKPEPRAIVSNDGTARMYTPQSMERRVEAILTDVYTKEGVDPHDRWNKVDAELRVQAERILGPMPIGTLGDIDLADAVYYSARDADAALRLYRRLGPELKARSLADLMEHGMDVLPVFEEMQANGMPASRVYFERLHEEMTDEMGRLQARISHRFFNGEPFNPASQQQVAKMMKRRNLRGTKKTKTGAMSTGRKSIEHLRHTDDAIGAIIDWREHQKIRDAFCQPVLDRIPAGEDLHPIRCQIKTTRVHTRRLAAANPNLLAIPVRHELGRKVRSGYVCAEGEVFGAWDLSQIEMRYMAHLAEDPLLCAMFQEGKDVHSETAARIFRIPIDKVDAMAHRYPAKRAGFGIITNIQGAGLYDQLRMSGCDGWSEDSCSKLIADWLGVFSGVARFLDECKKDVRDAGVVYDHWGMPRYLPGVWSSDFKARAEAERTASSHKIQGGAQGMIQNSMRWLRPQIREMQRAGVNVAWRLQVHDELILTFDEDLWDVMDALVMEALTQHCGIKLRVPVEASGNMSKSWGGLK